NRTGSCGTKTGQITSQPHTNTTILRCLVAVLTIQTTPSHVGHRSQLCCLASPGRQIAFSQETLFTRSCSCSTLWRIRFEHDRQNSVDPPVAIPCDGSSRSSGARGRNIELQRSCVTTQPARRV